MHGKILEGNIFGELSLMSDEANSVVNLSESTVKFSCSYAILATYEEKFSEWSNINQLQIHQNVPTTNFSHACVVYNCVG